MSGAGEPNPPLADGGIKPRDSASQVETSGSSSVSLSTSQKSWKVKLAKLTVQQQTLRKEAELVLQQQELEFRVAEVEGR